MPNSAAALELSAGSPPKVYSYTRFSTPEQAAGDSYRRQIDGARKWAERQGLELDMRLSRADCGVSAFRGTNAGEDRGLGEFLHACRSNLIEPGSYLLVESLDRISRMTPRRAQRLLDDIVDAGVIIVTLSDGQEYDATRLDNDPTALLISLMVSWRAHEESKTKGKRLAAAWAEKRRRVREGVDLKLTRRAPPWLQWTGSQWQADGERAAVVQRVYRMTIEGVGEHRIAETLNREGVAPLGRGRMWHRSAVSKLLRTPTVIGTLVPGHMEFIGTAKRRVLEQPIANAYPAIIDAAQWHTVRAIKDGSAAAVRGRGAKAPLSNFLAGLARCPDCGAAMTRVMKGRKGGNPKLVCTRAKAGAANHPYRSIDLPQIESAFFDGWQPALLANVPAGERGGSLDDDWEALESEIVGTEERLDRLVEAMERMPSAALAGSIRAVEAQLVELRKALQIAEERRSLADGGLIGARLAALQEAILTEPRSVAAINAALRSLFDGATVDHASGHLRFQWKQGGFSELVYAWPEVG